MLQKVVKTSLFFTTLSVLASGLNFLYYPLVSRSLSFSQFGDVQIGIAFIMQAAALFTSLNILALFFAAQNEQTSFFTISLERLVIAASLVLAIIVAVFAPPIAHSLHLADYRVLFILSIIFVINIPCATWLGSLQGNGQFIASGAISVASSAAKIAFGILAITFFHLGTYGALLGVLAGSLIILPLAYFAQTEKVISFRHTFTRLRRSDLGLFRRHPQILLIFLSLLLLALASTLDIVFSKISLPPDTAGRYAQLSTVAKIPYFAAVPVTIILFERFIRRSMRPRVAFTAFVVFVAAATGATLLLQSLLVERFFHGHSDVNTLSMLCVAFSIYVITTLVIYELLSRKKVFRALLGSASVLLLSITLLSLDGHSERSIAHSYLFAQGVSLMLAFGLQYTSGHEQ